VIRELKTLLAVANYGTFAAAGERIGLTQGAVSAQIHRLEDALGFKLFDRTGRSASLNAAGREAVARAGDLLQRWEELRGMIEGTPAKGELRIGAVASVQSTWLPLALKSFRDEFPYVTIKIVPGVSLMFLGQVEAGELDLAIMIKQPFSHPRKLKWESLAHDPFKLLCHKAVAGDDWREILLREPFVRYDRSSFGGRQVTEFLKANNISTEYVLELDDMEGIVQAVRRQIGVALMPITPHTALPEEVRAISLGEAMFFRELGVVSQESLALGSVTKRLVEHLKNAVRSS
jgi:DNA-binding transcriptional LysR family regulator